jgi:hypothetical protein
MRSRFPNGNIPNGLALHAKPEVAMQQSGSAKSDIAIAN